MSRNKDHEKAQQTDEVHMVQVVRLIKKKKIDREEKKCYGAEAIPESQGDTYRRHTSRYHMYIHTNDRPWAYPIEPVVAKMKGRVNPILLDPAFHEDHDDLSEQNQTEAKAESDEGVDGDGHKQLVQGYLLSA